MGHRVLVVDDEYRMRRVLELMLSGQGYEVKTAPDGIQAMEIWRKWEPHVVLTDIRMPGADGMEVLNFKTSQGLPAPLIILTAFGTIDMAVAAIKQGAYDYLTKPFDNEKVIEVVRRALQDCGAAQAPGQGPAPMIGSSKAMQEIFRDIATVADTPTSVLITGESGTGKELVARAIHNRSGRSQQKLVRVNCAAIPADLLESELFGHRKGAFTGAVADRKGSFLKAHGGSIFLDEIADLPMGLQPKLLHAVEEKTVTPVGSDRAVKVDVKVISATNRDIRQMVAQGMFREDLYFRLNAFNIHLPPLRERVEDIEALAGYFLECYRGQFKSSVRKIDRAAIDVLKTYSWPGNVRELRNAIERALLACTGNVIRVTDLPPGITREENSKTASSTRGQLDLEQTERRLIERALDKTGGNQARAARLLNISRNTLRYRMKKHGIFIRKAE